MIIRVFSCHTGSLVYFHKYRSNKPIRCHNSSVCFHLCPIVASKIWASTEGPSSCSHIAGKQSYIVVDCIDCSNFAGTLSYTAVDCTGHTYCYTVDCSKFGHKYAVGCCIDLNNKTIYLVDCN